MAVKDRTFSGDAPHPHQPSRHRLGTHYEALPVNAPKCPVHNYHKDGAMRFFANNPYSDA